jgi:MinD-like ATPase involved in chromosome partitioning or flagellar assembly
MTERDRGDDRDYPDGSVGRYVRERWGAAPPEQAPARAARPYIRPVEPHPPRPAPEAEGRAGDEDTEDGADMWAYQPEPDWRGGDDSRAVHPGWGREATEGLHDEKTTGAANGRAHDMPSEGAGAKSNGSGSPRTSGAGDAEVLFDGPVGLEDADTAGSGQGAEGSPGGLDSADADTDTAGSPGAAGTPHTARLAVPRGWASDNPPDPEPGGPIADPRKTNAPVSPRRGESHAFGAPPRGAGRAVPRGPSTGPLPAIPHADDRAHAAPPPFGGPQHEPPLRPAMPTPRNTSPHAAHWTDPVAVAAQELQRARQPERTDLSSARLLRHAKRPPQSGWRRMVYVLSGRMLNPGESPTDIRRRELTMRVNQPLLGCYKIAMLSLKGGVGKTTMTATLGATFASLRGDRVVAVDANPDRGTLSQKIPLETSATVRNLLRDAQRVRRYTDVRAYTSQGPSRLEVLASEQDPAVSEAFSEEDYRRTVDLLEHFYNIVLTDCGTGLMHSAMYGVLGVADQLVIVSSGSIDGARSASATMDWLDAHGHGELVANSVVVINFVHRSRGGVDLNRVSEHFAARCRAVVRIPFDAHLDEGAEIDLDRLEPSTRMALLDLAANVADAFESVHAL